jgi:hypothetical protein
MHKVDEAVLDQEQLQDKDTADQLERIMLSAVRDPKWSNVRSAVNGFSRDMLYQWYLSLCGDKPNPEIVEYYKTK